MKGQGQGRALSPGLLSISDQGSGHPSVYPLYLLVRSLPLQMRNLPISPSTSHATRRGAQFRKVTESRRVWESRVSRVLEEVPPPTILPSASKGWDRTGRAGQDEEATITEDTLPGFPHALPGSSPPRTNFRCRLGRKERILCTNQLAACF